MIGVLDVALHLACLLSCAQVAVAERSVTPGIKYRHIYWTIPRRAFGGLDRVLHISVVRSVSLICYQGIWLACDELIRLRRRAPLWQCAVTNVFHLLMLPFAIVASFGLQHITDSFLKRTARYVWQLCSITDSVCYTQLSVQSACDSSHHQAAPTAITEQLL